MTELGPVARAEKAEAEVERLKGERKALGIALQMAQREVGRKLDALDALVSAAAPIEEDGGSDDQRERFSEAFQNACAEIALHEVESV